MLSFNIKKSINGLTFKPSIPLDSPDTFFTREVSNEGGGAMTDGCLLGAPLQAPHRRQIHYNSLPYDRCRSFGLDAWLSLTCACALRAK